MTDLSIAAVLEHFGADLHNVRETGWRPVRCPFHEDRIASASVNLELNAFACHACEARGDSIALIKQQEGTDFLGAVEWANSVLGASMPDVSRSAKKRKVRKRSAWRHTLFD